MKISCLLSILGTVALIGCSAVHPFSNSTVSPSSATKPLSPPLGYQYGTKSVYLPQEDRKNYQPVPDGYALVYTELVARHGARALSSPKYDVISLKIWQKAKAEHALTPMGEALGAEIARLMAANQKMGYGNLSQLGKQEHMQIGMRLALRDKALFEKAGDQDKSIAVEYSGQPRAKASALSFVQGLEKIEPALASRISAPQVNRKQLYFHKMDKAYQDYKSKNAQLRHVIGALFDSPKTHEIARTVMERIYQPQFVDALANGQYAFLGQGKKHKRVYDDVDAAMQLFNLYLIAPGLVAEAGQQPWRFTMYFTPQETQWFVYLSDAENFYKKGPGLDNTNITYRMAKVLEDGFFNEVKQVKSGTNHRLATLRFAHAETIIPFAAQMGLEGSTQSASLQAGYTQTNNPWRGSWVSPYSANIQWDVFRNHDGNLLVRMLYNEKEIGFKAGCRPIEKQSYFYSFDELTRCYNQ